MRRPFTRHGTLSNPEFAIEMQRLLDGQEELQRKQVDTHQIALRITAYLRSELGFDSESAGNINRRMTETWEIVRAHEKLLRGEGDQLGLVGWVQVLRRTWWSAVVALGTLSGYVLGSVFPLPGQ